MLEFKLKFLGKWSNIQYPLNYFKNNSYFLKRKYDRNTKTWTLFVGKDILSLQELDKLIKELEKICNQHKVILQFESLEKLKFFLEISQQLLTITPKKFHIDFVKLFDFQKIAVDYMLQALKYRKAVFNCDALGLGKTFMALSVAKMINSKTLVLAPLKITYDWEATARDYFKINAKILNTKKPDFNADLIITTYETFSGFLRKNVSDTTYKTLMNLKNWAKSCNLIIMDEAHRLKNKYSYRYQAVKTFLEENPQMKAIFLTGTPFQNRVEEYRNLLQLTDFWSPMLSQCFGSYYNGFKTEYYIKKPEEFKIIMQSLGWIRRTKEEVLQELPPYFIKVILLDWKKDKQISDLDSAIKAIIKKRASIEELLEESYEQLEESPTTFNLLGQIAKIRPLLWKAKKEKTIEFIEDLLEEEKPIIVFAHHKEVINDLYNYFSTNYSVGVITGETKNPFEVKTKFQDGQYDILLLSIRACSEGLTLTRANIGIFVELDYNPKVIEQAIGRLHRIGQHRNVLIYYLLLKNSFEEYILKLIYKKEKIFNKIIQTSEVIKNAIPKSNGLNL